MAIGQQVESLCVVRGQFPRVARSGCTSCRLNALLSALRLPPPRRSGFSEVGAEDPCDSRQVFLRSLGGESPNQLLLFLRLRGKVAEPLDKATCMDLIDLVRTRSLREILERHGAIGAYEKASRLPVGATSGLPTITRATSTARSSSRSGAYQHGASSPFERNEKKGKGRGAGPSSAVY